MCLVCFGVAVGSATGVFGEAPVVEAPALPPLPVVTQEVPWQSAKPADVLADTRCAKAGKAQVFEGVTYVCKEEGKKLKWVKQKP